VGSFTEKGSALINIAVVGGAVFPPLQGMVADARTVQLSYLVPCCCFVLIVCYGIFCHKRYMRMKGAMQTDGEGAIPEQPAAGTGFI
jgi:FHS family L-fucose permease-like MFS transporter